MLTDLMYWRPRLTRWLFLKVGVYAGVHDFLGLCLPEWNCEDCHAAAA